MLVPRHILAILALAAAAIGGGCGEREGALLPAETDEPYFLQGRQLQKQGRNPEALTAYLKVIDKRGERASPESHLEVGQIYLNHTKDPVEAYHHFRKYLELQPNSHQKELVRGMVKAAAREHARAVLGQPMSDQSLRLQADEQIETLRRENNELRAEVAVLRGGGAVVPLRAPRIISVPIETRPPLVNVPETPVVNSPVGNSPIAPAPQRQAGAAPPVFRPAPALPPSAAPAPARGPTSAKATPAAGGRTHTVAKGDTLYGLSRRFGVKPEDIAAANGMPSVAAPLKLGTVLRIPAAVAPR